MPLTVLDQSQRTERRAIYPLHLVDIVLPGGITLHLCDQNFRYRYASSSILYESYIKDIRGLGEIVSSGDSGPNNSDVSIIVANKRWGSVTCLAQLNATNAFTRADVTIYELRLVDREEVFASDVRKILWKGKVEQFRDVSLRSFTLQCSSRLFDCRNNWGLKRVDRAVDAYAAPGDVGQWRNIAYGALENVPCRCVKTGAIDLLAEDITSASTTITLQGLRRFEFLSSGSVQIGTEIIPYTGRSGDQLTGCTITRNHSTDDPVLQVLDQFVYEVASHPVRAISKVMVDSYDNSDAADAYTAQSGSVLTGYADRAVIAFNVTPEIKKQINPDMDKHTHTQNSVNTRMPSGFTKSSTGAYDGANCYDRSRSTYGYLTDDSFDSYFDFTLSTTSGVQPIVSKVRIWFLLEAYSGTYGNQLRGNVSITHNGLTVGYIPHGTYLPKQWMSFEAEANSDFVNFDQGYRITKDTTGETGTYIRIYETYIEKYVNGSKVSPTGCTNVSNASYVYDGNTSTYASPSSSSSISITFAPDTKAERPKKITTRLLISIGSAPSSNIVVTRDDKVLHTFPSGSTVTKQWFEWYDNDPYDRSAAIVISGGHYTASVRLYECYVMIEESSTGIDPYEFTKQVSAETIASGLHTAELVIGDQVLVDLEGYQDDASGTYTGTGSALISRPDHVFKHFLIVLCNQSSSDIGATFAASGSNYASSGYAFAFLAHDISQDAQQLLSLLARQCRSSFNEWGGKYELRFLPSSAPQADFALNSDDLIELPVFDMTPTRELCNHWTAFYRRYYPSSRKTSDAVLRRIDPEAVSKGFMASPLIASSGTADLKRELILNAVRDEAMAQDVLDFELSRTDTPKLSISLQSKWRAIKTSPAECFSYTDPIFGAGVYRIMEFRPDRSSKRIAIKGLQA